MIILFNNNNTDHVCAPTAEPQNVNLSENCYRLLSTQHTTRSWRWLANVHLFFFIISLYSSWASHPIPYYAHPARNQRSRCAPRAPHCLLPCSYLAPTLLQPTLLLSSSYFPPTLTTCATLVRTTLAIEEKKNRLPAFLFDCPRPALPQQVVNTAGMSASPRKSPSPCDHRFVQLTRPMVQGHVHQSPHLGKCVSDRVPDYEPVRAELHSAGTKLRVDRCGIQAARLAVRPLAAS